jgi:hypothetical protein
MDKNKNAASLFTTHCKVDTRSEKQNDSPNATHQPTCVEYPTQSPFNISMASLDLESASMTPDLLARRPSLLLKPSNERIERELLVRNAASRRRCARSLCGSCSSSRRSYGAGDHVDGGRRDSWGGGAGSGGRSGSRSSDRSLGAGRRARAGTGEESRAGDLVAAQVTGVDVDEETGVGSGVELVCGFASGGLGAGACDFQVYRMLVSTVLISFGELERTY